jgi:ABC-2 type transport system ATP-binding protein
MDPVLEAAGLGKRFGAVAALDGLNLVIPRGGVYGVLGPNGAGKSTLFRLALGLVRPTAGEVRLLGRKVGDGNLRAVGAMIETPRFAPYLSALDVLNMLALAGGKALSRGELRGRLDRVGLGEAAERKAHGFSVGMKQRLGVAAALLGDPELVILDEPTSGMDPGGINEMRAFIRELADRDGVTVILASHQLAEVQRVCDRVAILDKGKLAAEGGVTDLVAGQERLRLLVSPIPAALAVLGADARQDGDAVIVTVTRAATPGVIRQLVEHGVEVSEARWVGGDLEKVFLQQTGGSDAR